MNRPRSNRILQAAVVAFLALTTCASTPGHISGCSAGGSSGPDPVAFCRNKQTYICARNLALDGDREAHTACLAGINTQCSGVNWPVGCSPTQAAIDACLMALVAPGRIGEPAESIVECNVLCGGGGGIDPEGI